MKDLLKVSEISVNYKLESDSILALDHVSFDLPEGHTVGIVGESGSGKTTLGMAIMNVIEPPGVISSGSVEFQGRDVLKMSHGDLKSYRWQQVAMVYQSAMNSLSPVKRASDHITEVLKEHTGLSKSKSRERAIELLESAGIRRERADDYPHELSGGMRQRVVIALALALYPKILIADEPTSALDVVVQRQILNLLRKEILDKKMSLIFITHEISLLNGLVDEVDVMYSGEIVEAGAIDHVLREPLHPYTEMLVSTLLTFDSNLSMLSRIENNSQKEAMQTFSTNSCKYVTRCKYAFDKCKRERPRLREVKQGRYVACHKFN